MEALLKKLDINANQSNEEILSELENKQMEYLERLDRVEDKKRRAQLEEELEAIEDSINALKWTLKHVAMGMKRDTKTTEANLDIEELKRSNLTKETNSQAVETVAIPKAKSDEELYDEALAMMSTDDYIQGVEAMKRLAESGYCEAQCKMGLMYSEGNRVEKDHSIAYIWFQKAADQGHARAQHNLGYKYDVGEGVEQNYEKAVEWYEKAANQGNARAQCNLGVMYECGRGIAKIGRAHV